MGELSLVKRGGGEDAAKVGKIITLTASGGTATIVFECPLEISTVYHLYARGITSGGLQYSLVSTFATHTTGALGYGACAVTYGKTGTYGNCGGSNDFAAKASSGNTHTVTFDLTWNGSYITGFTPSTVVVGAVYKD